MGQIDDYNIGRVLVRVHPVDNDMDDNGSNTEGWGRVQRHRDSRGLMEGLHINREQLNPNFHCPT